MRTNHPMPDTENTYTPVPARYVKVIVPVRLDRVLTYRVPEALYDAAGIGARVKVRLGPRLTDAVVCETDVTPDIDPGRIHDIAGVDEGLERITPEEIRLWRFIADYYLCTQGEVFKCAYPSGKIRSEETAARVRERAEASRRKMEGAARERVAKLEAEMDAVRNRTEEALAGLTDKAVKTRQKLIENRDARLSRLEEALTAARAALKSMGESGASLGAGGSALRDAGKNPSGECKQFEGALPPTIPRGSRATDIAYGSVPPSAGRSGERLLSATADAPKPLQQALQTGKPVLLQGSAPDRFETYETLVADTLMIGRTALMLVPEIALTEAFETRLSERFGAAVLVFHSQETTARRRKIADALRTDGPHFLIGTRSALFLPYHGLDLIIVDEEQDRSYKQDSPAPRYNARDCAVVLGGIHGARVLLGSAAPSLESLYNCATRRYTGVQLPGPPVIPGKTGNRNRWPVGAGHDNTPAQAERLRIIDTAAERRKRGMKGSFSIKLMDEINYTLAQGRTAYLIRLWGDLAPTVEEARGLFPDAEVLPLTEAPEDQTEARILVGTLAQTKRLAFAEGSLVALLQADPILGAQDFRADERAFQLLSRYREHCAAGTFVIQTARSAHPVFQDLLEGRDPAPELMEERRAFGYPPYSRIVDICLDDPNPKRLALMGRALGGRLKTALRPGVGLDSPVRIEGPFETAENRQVLRVILAKDRSFPERKKALKTAVDDFIAERKYNGFIHLDVDPE